MFFSLYHIFLIVLNDRIRFAKFVQKNTNTGKMYKCSVIFFLSLGTAIITNVAGAPDPSYKVYPLILFQTSEDKLQHPTGYEVTNGIFFSYKMFKFTAHDAKKELLFCPATDNDRIKLNIKAHGERGQSGVVTVAGDDYYNVEIAEFFVSTFIKKVNMRKDLARCEKEPEPFISEIFAESDEIQKDGDHGQKKMILCGPKGNGKLYRYGYEILLNEELLNKVKNNLGPGLTISKLHPKDDMIDYEIYRFCYDDKTKEIIYTQHKLISPQLLLEPHLWRERRHHYEMSSNNYGLEELNFEEREKKYQKYLLKKFREKTSSEEKTRTPEPSHTEQLFETEQLVPVNDFALALWMKPTKHYLNVDLMNRKLSRLWDQALKTIQLYAHSHQLELDVFTKTFNMVPENSDDDERNPEIGLEENDEIISEVEAPQIWIKIIVNRLPDERGSKGVAIIVNNLMNTKLNPQIEKYCGIDYCRKFEIKEFPDEYLFEYVRCCSINDKIEKLFNLNPKLNIISEEAGLILIEGLINIPSRTDDLKPINIGTGTGTEPEESM